MNVLSIAATAPAVPRALCALTVPELPSRACSPSGFNMAKTKSRLGRKPPDVPGPIGLSPVRPFVADDLVELRNSVSATRNWPAIDPPAIREFVDMLNEGVIAFVAQARRERFATAGDAAKWNSNVQAKALALLSALGIHPIYTPTFEDRPPVDDEIPAASIFALAPESRDHEIWHEEIGLPKGFNNAVRQAVGTVWYLSLIAGASAKTHASRKRSGRAIGATRPDQREFTSRQRLICFLAVTYEALCQETIKKHLNALAEKSPFTRYCQCAFAIVSSRIEVLRAQSENFLYAFETDDVEDLQRLSLVSAVNIRDDVQGIIYDRLQVRKARRNSEPIL